MSATYGRAFATVFALLLAIHAPLTRAGDPPDLALNPATGSVESVDIATDSGHRVRRVEDQLTTLGETAHFISTEAGISPRIACRSDGQTWVVWWRDSDPDEVYFSYGDPGTGEWSDEALLSEPGEPSRHPELVVDGLLTWVVYETDDGPVAGVAVRAITDSPEPFDTRVVVATTDYDGDVNVMLHADSSQLWVTWVDSGDDVGWSEYDHASETWGLPRYEPYFDGNIKAAIETIHETILGL